jgi:CHAT domain
MTSYPIVAQYELPDPGKRGPLGIGKRRDNGEIPKIKPHEVLVWRVSGRYVVDDGKLRAHDDTVVRASSVTVVSVRPGTEVEVSFQTGSMDASEFSVKATFICSVLDPEVVVRDGQVNVADTLLAYLKRDQALSNLGLAHPIEEIAKVRTKMGVQVKSYMTLQPPKIPGMEITLVTVQVGTPTAHAEIGKLHNERLTELQEQHEASLDARRQIYILEEIAKLAETVADDPRQALDLAYADGRMTSQEYTERLRQIDQAREQAERLAAAARQMVVEDRDAQPARQDYFKEETAWQREQLERREAMQRRRELEAQINLLRGFAERGHLDALVVDIEELMSLFRGDVTVGPGVFGTQTAPTQDGAEVEHADINVAADMPSRMHVGRVVSVACRLSRAPIETAADRTRDGGRISADAARLITLEVLPKVNAEVVGEDRADVPVPGEGQTRETYFDVRATHTGTCQVWVVIRQGPLPLLTLRLEAVATDAQPTESIARHPAKAKISMGSPMGLENVNWLSVVEIDRGPETVYRFELRSTTLGILASFESRPLRNRAEYVASLYREIESRWLTSAGDREAFQEELREFGGSLFSQLFPEPLQEALWQQKDRLRHLMVLSSEPFIPWELVHLKEPGGPLPDETRFMAEIGLVRWLYTRDSAYPPQALHARPGRVRVLRPDYPSQDLHLPHTLPEAQFLHERLGATPVASAAREIRTLLRTGGFDILHFAGHGIADPSDIARAKILLQGRHEKGSYIPAYLSATTVAQQARLVGSDGSKPLIVLNACQTGRLGQQMSSLGGFAQAFLDRGAGAFISTMWSVGDAPASTFIQTLYEGLLNRQPMSAAATKARHKARHSGDATWLAYAVYAHPHARLLPAHPA